MKRIVIVGASVAGLRAAQAIRRHGYDAELTIVGEEVHRPYFRPPLSKDVLLSTATPKPTQLENLDEPVDAVWLLGCRASRLDTDRRRVGLETGDELPFDGLVIATGAQPRQPHALSHHGIETLRSFDDARRIRDRIHMSQKVLIVGAGFLGSEVASALCTLGRDVTVVEASGSVLTPLGPQAGTICEAVMRAAGITLRLQTTIADVDSVADEALSVALSDGSQLKVDLIVFAAGTIPAVDWMTSSGIECGGGVHCDAGGCVLGTTRIVAAGDVARWRHFLGPAAPRTEHWSAAAEQGDWAGRRLLDNAIGPLRHVPSFWSDQFGLRIQVAGFPNVADDAFIASGSFESHQFIQLFSRSRRLVGAVAFNMPRAITRARRLIAKEEDLTPKDLAWCCS